MGRTKNKPRRNVEAATGTAIGMATAMAATDDVNDDRDAHGAPITSLTYSYIRPRTEINTSIRSTGISDDGGGSGGTRSSDNREELQGLEDSDASDVDETKTSSSSFKMKSGRKRKRLRKYEKTYEYNTNGNEGHEQGHEDQHEHEDASARNEQNMNIGNGESNEEEKKEEDYSHISHPHSHSKLHVDNNHNDNHTHAHDDADADVDATMDHRHSSISETTTVADINKNDEENDETTNNNEMIIVEDKHKQQQPTQTPEIEIIKCRRKHCNTILRIHALDAITPTSTSSTSTTSTSTKSIPNRNIVAVNGNENANTNASQNHSHEQQQQKPLQVYHLSHTALEMKMSTQNEIGAGADDDNSTNTRTRACTYSIKSYTTIHSILTHMKRRKSNLNNCMHTLSNIDVNIMVNAHQHNLMSVLLRPYQNESENAKASSSASASVCNVAVEIYCTDYAYQVCHPNVLHKKNSMAMSNMVCVGEYMRVLFPHSILEDCLPFSSPSPNKGKGRNNKKEEKEQVEITAKTVYSAVDNRHSLTEETTSMTTVPGLVPSLRPYQSSAVQWMIKRETQTQSQQDGEGEGQGNLNENEENNNNNDSGWEICWCVLGARGVGQNGNGSNADAVPLYEWRKQNNGNMDEDNDDEAADSGIYVYYNPFMGWLVRSYSDAKKYTIGDISDGGVRGGILAESMGLGKTVEVLACILSNPYPGPNANTKTIDGISANTSITKNAHITGLIVNYNDHDPDNDNDDDNDMICYCGRGTGSSNDTFSWVKCSKCRQPMHGLCAGFQSEDELRRKCVRQSNASGRRSGKATSSKRGRTVYLCREEYCPTCITSQHYPHNLIQSRATLIVTPPSILSQWEREIRRHTMVKVKSKEGDGENQNVVRPLVVKVYHGVKDLCHMSHKTARETGGRKMINAHYLADADVVLTTFQALMQDLHHSNENPYACAPTSENGSRGRGHKRTRKRYRVIASPLQSIQFWRLCLDEAQRVETPTAKSARMALKLQGYNRWCISGTPIGRNGMDDLHGLLLFLQSRPFESKHSLKKCVRGEYRDMQARISHMLKDILWRSTKMNECVRRQMGIPEQIEKKSFLKFSSVERHFYTRQLEETILAASTVSQQTNSANGNSRKKTKTRRSKDADLLHHQLHRLRAACCHPQVGTSGIGGKVSKKAKSQKDGGSGGGPSIANGVLSMSQILDRLIDDAKLKAEEAQRLYILNTNALACLHGLYIKGKERMGAIVDECDEIKLLQKSCEEYLNAVQCGDRNAAPAAIVGEAVVTGNNGFQFPNVIVRDGLSVLGWTMQNEEDEDEDDSSGSYPEAWARFDFNGATKKINSIAVRPLMKAPSSIETSCSHTQVVYPKECILQVSNAAIGGMFVDALSFVLIKPTDTDTELDSIGKCAWQQIEGGLRPHKSKSWRILIKSYHDVSEKSASVAVPKVFVGMEIQLMEPDIVPDSLQRLHILHNGALTLDILQQKQRESGNDDGDHDLEEKNTNGKFCEGDIAQHLRHMQDEKKSLESHYIEAARVLQIASQQRLLEATVKRKDIMKEIHALNGSKGRRGIESQPWWQDLLALCHLEGKVNIQSSLVEYVEERLFELYNDPSQPYSRRTFPRVQSLDGLTIALRMRMEANTFFPHLGCDDDKDEGKHNQVLGTIQKITDLSDHPTDAEIFENSHCHKCRSDWEQKGPKCKCCFLEEELLKHQESVKDVEINCILSAMHQFVKQGLRRHGMGSNKNSSSATVNMMTLEERAGKFLEFKDAVLKELDCAKSKWRTHLDLLSDIDELNQCKRTMRLVYKDENLFGLSNNEQAFLVQPRDIPALIMDHSAKQAMAEGTLRKSKELLRFLKNQNLERKQQQQQHDDDDNYDNNNNICSICLCPFKNDRAVLRCGHTYHYSPCLERLIARSGGSQTITCPMRCAIRTKREDILIASEIRKDDGSRTKRKIEGSWGTKVDRLISDLIGVVEIGEKSIVFSQWDDMLAIMEHALQANHLRYVRPRGLKKFGDAMKFFRTSNCHVLLMHVKHGAEGLTLVEANHIFMIEPLINHSMDSQAINRIHRIGQTSKTYIHRYIIEDTIEVKIDRIRVERQSHDGQEEKKDVKHSQPLRAGGVDGGFNESELKELLR